MVCLLLNLPWLVFVVMMLVDLYKDLYLIQNSSATVVERGKRLGNKY